MKKIILSFVLLLAVQGVQAQDCSTLKCPAPYDLTSGFSRGMSTVTGQKFLSEKIGEKLVKKAIKKNITSGDIKVLNLLKSMVKTLIFRVFTFHRLMQKLYVISTILQMIKEVIIL